MADITQTGPNGAPAASFGQPQQTEPQQAEIDIQALAEEVFRLLKKEMRIERERMGRNSFGRRSL